MGFRAWWQEYGRNGLNALRLQRQRYEQTVRDTYRQAGYRLPGSKRRGQFARAVERRRRRNELAKASRRANWT